MVKRQSDRMSKLEFVAIQFGVKFTIILDLQGYVDKVNQRYLHYFTYFENFFTSYNYSIISRLF